MTFREDLETVLQLEAEGRRRLAAAEAEARQELARCRDEARRLRLRAEEEMGREEAQRRQEAEAETGRSLDAVRERTIAETAVLRARGAELREAAVRRVLSWLEED